MANAKLWTFQQLGGRPRAPMYLEGWAAPFGRPRRGTIVNMGLSVRHTTTHYAGRHTVPTVHEFGTMGKPFELHGRWMDAALPSAGAISSYVRDWKDFIADGKQVRATWGDILSYRVFLHDFDAEIESETDVAWKLQGEVLVDEAAPSSGSRDAPGLTTPSDYARDLFSDLKLVTKPFRGTSLQDILNILPEIADYANDMMTVINAPFSAIYDTLSAITDFGSALSSDLSKIAAGTQTVKTGILNLRDLGDLFVSRVMTLKLQSYELSSASSSAAADRLSAFRVPDVEIDFMALADEKTNADVATVNLLALMADLQNEISLHTQGQVQASYVARDGDSWESIASRQLGSPDGARAVKSLNAIRYGDKPQPGKKYGIPSAV